VARHTSYSQVTLTSDIRLAQSRLETLEDRSRFDHVHLPLRIARAPRSRENFLDLGARWLEPTSEARSLDQRVDAAPLCTVTTTSLDGPLVPALVAAFTRT
jgi:hypothetical protein